MIYTFSTTRSRAASWLLLQRVFLSVGAEMAEGGIAAPEDNAEDGVAKQVMLGEPPEVVVVHVWRGLHCIGVMYTVLAMRLISAVPGYVLWKGAMRLQRPWQESVEGY